MTVYNLLQELYVLLDDGDRRALSESQLTITQYSLLSRLQRDVGKGHTVTELAEQLLCTRGNITRLVQRLQREDLVEVGSDPDDQRLVRIALTPEGHRRLEAARKAHEASLERRIGALEPQKLEQLVTLTDELANLLKQDLFQQDLSDN